MSSDTLPVRFINYYKHCGIKWTDDWSCACNDKCPTCGKEIEPYTSEDIGTYFKVKVVLTISMDKGATRKEAEDIASQYLDSTCDQQSELGIVETEVK